MGPQAGAPVSAGPGPESQNHVVGSVDPGSPLGLFLSVAPMITCMGCFLLPGLTARQIFYAKSTGDTPVLPFLSMATQCTIWLCYGVMVDNATIYIPNSAGLVLGALYTLIFNNFASKSDRPGLRTQYAVCVLLLLTLSLVLLLAQPEMSRSVFAFVAAGGSVIFAFSPLAALVTVIRRQSTESMPFMTSLILFLNGGLWFAFGWLVRPDPAVWVPNLLGTIGGTLQLLVHSYFALRPRQPQYFPVIGREMA